MWKCMWLFPVTLLVQHLQVAATQLSPDTQKLALFQFQLSLAINSSAAYCTPSPPKTLNWSMTSDCCTWDGITCDHKTGDVIGLDLFCSQLVGSILPNSTLFQLSHLQFLDLGSNDLYGVLPEKIFHLPNLKELSLGNNDNLIISLPKVKWGCSSSLQKLSLSSLNLLGGIPESIGYLESLESLWLFKCKVTRPIPRSIGNLTQLTILNLSFNNLSGQIPISLANLQSLTFLQLDHNNFHGPFPYWICNLPLLETLTISDNSLTGPLPSNLTALCLPKLMSLDLRNNSLNGTLPSWLFNLPSLTDLYIDDNRFTGQLYEFGSSRLLMWSFSCSNNLLNGTIPQSFSGLVNITSLDFSSNNFSGVLDVEMFSHLRYLEALGLSHNSLSLTITSTTTLSPYLYYLSLSSCNIREFPHFIRSLDLGYLDLSNNQIGEEIPQSIGSTGKYSWYYLNLSHNSLTGGLEHLPWNGLMYLDLQSNMLNGSSLAPICNSSSLVVLNLSHNKLSGVLPTCPRSLNHSISVIDLRMNNIGGSLPSSLSNFRKLRSLNLHGNKLEGTIPLSFAEFDYLQVLDLGSNRINDMFPWCLEALPSLEVLVLRSNIIHGSIKNNSKIDHPFPSLRIIDLSYNEFSGLLPAKYIKNFNAMMDANANNEELKYMGDSFYKDSISVIIKGVEFEIVRILTLLTTIDLSLNKFEGEIPNYIGNLVSLRYLNLSHNQLAGEIPSLIGNLSMLESLDLSCNQLVGKIPQQLTGIYSLSRLNLSQNQLSSRIPKGYQFNTFGNDSYAGNLELCGNPLSRKCEIVITETQQEADEDDDYFFSGFTWKAVVIGYGGGLVVGFVGGYMMFMAGEPKWFARIVAWKLGHTHKVIMLEIGRFS